ncbi:hypothetical protein [Anaerotignum sp.]
MTEQERRRRRREMERRMRARQTMRGKEKQRGGLFAFRLYVTAVLAGGFLLISFFQTETSEMVCAKVRQVIAYQISAEELDVWKNRAETFFKGAGESLPVFEEKETQETEKRVYQPDAEASP